MDEVVEAEDGWQSWIARRRSEFLLWTAKLDEVASFRLRVIAKEGATAIREDVLFNALIAAVTLMKKYQEEHFNPQFEKDIADAVATSRAVRKQSGVHSIASAHHARQRRRSRRQARRARHHAE